MGKVKQFLFLLLVLVLLICGWAGWYILQSIIPEHFFNWYPVIPTFFFIFGILNIRILGKVNNKNPRKPVNIFMMVRLAKFILAFALLGTYYFLNGKVHFRDFALTFAIFYFIYLALETYFFYRTEKELKKELK